MLDARNENCQTGRHFNAEETCFIATYLPVCPSKLSCALQKFVNAKFDLIPTHAWT